VSLQDPSHPKIASRREEAVPKALEESSNYLGRIARKRREGGQKAGAPVRRLRHVSCNFGDRRALAGQPMRLLQLVPSILLIANSVSAASIFSRPQADDRQVSELSGTVAIIDTVSIRVRPDEGSVMTFVVDDPSSLPLGLVAGTRVTVKYETREGGGRRLLSVALALGSNPPPPEVPATTDASATAAPADPAPAALPLESAVSLRASAGVAPSLSEREAGAAAAPARRAAPGTCPLQLVAVLLLVATGALLVIASWR
jgi:hypothetical protein